MWRMHAKDARRLTMVALAALISACSPSPGSTASTAVVMASPTPSPASEGSPGALAYALDGDIYVSEWDGSNPVKIANGRPAGVYSADGSIQLENGCWDTGEYFALGPMWSPNGRYLAYGQMDCRPHEEYRWDVVISDRAGNRITSFTSFRSAGGIAWSPDSTRVAVWDEVWADSEKKIGIYGLDGVRQMLLEVPLDGYAMVGSDPMWSPDRESTLLWGGSSIPLDGSTPRYLPWVDREGDERITYSPDGRRVAVAADRSFVIAESDGSDPQEVSGDWGRWPGTIVWSPAGDRIAFTPTTQGSTVLGMLDVDAGTTTLVGDFGERGTWFDLIDFSPQGDRLLFSKWRHRAGSKLSLWSVNMDGTDLRRLVAGTVSGDWRPRG